MHFEQDVNRLYVLSSEQILAIEEAQKQFKNGQFLKSDKADQDIDEWISKNPEDLKI